MFKIATWNVNSIRVRLEQVLGWPVGYRAAFAGEKTYNGYGAPLEAGIELA